MVKLTIVFSYRADRPAADCERHFRTQHAALVAKHAEVLRVRRYVQSPRIASDLTAQMADSRGWSSAADAVSELWWDSQEDMTNGFSSPEGQAAGAALAVDETEFCDSSTVVAFLTEEHAVIERSHAS
jgi:uncharacterized protein (TIGR02118 family)